MKVSHDTPHLLVLDYTSWFWALFLPIPILVCLGWAVDDAIAGNPLSALAALASSAFWGMVMAFLVERKQVILNRRTGTVTLRRRTMLRHRQDVFALSGLDRAEAQAHIGSEGDMTWRPVLVFETGQDRGVHPVTPVYTAGQGAHRAADAINGWLSRAAAD